MENIYEIIGKLLAAFVVGLIAYLAPKARAWFVANTDKTTRTATSWWCPLPGRRSSCTTTPTPMERSAGNL